MRSFLNTCRRFDFDPVILTYHRDRMSCHNIYKRALVAPMFVERIFSKWRPVWRRRHLINVEKVEKCRLDEIEVGGISLPEIHRRLFDLALPGTRTRMVDGSAWLGGYAQGARDCYVDLFQGLTGNLLLIEDFKTGEEEASFFSQTVRPAYLAACEVLGTQPNIMRLIPGRFTNSPLWYAYPDHYRQLLAASGVRL